MRKYNIDMMAIQETHLTTTDIYSIETTDGRRRYTVYLSGRTGEGNNGVGIITRGNMSVKFKSISDRICLCETNIKSINRKVVLMCAYAPTLPNSEKNPQCRENFYQQLDSILNTISKRSILIIAGDFNAQVGTGYHTFRANMGPYGKGRLNSNGESLLHMASRNNLTITNTLFPHPLKHVTTWEAPYRAYKHWDGTERKHPIRNQIDFILMRIPHRILVTDSRSYSGTYTFTDHRLVRAKLTIFNFGNKPEKTRKIAFEKLKDPIIRAQYAFSTEMHLMDLERCQENEPTTQDMWNKITEANRKAAVDTIGYRDSKKTYDPVIIRLSREQKDLGTALNGNTDPRTRDEIRKRRNGKMNEIHTHLKELRHKTILDLVEEVERSKNDSRKMFRALEVFRLDRKKPQLQIETGDGITLNATIQTSIITEHFKGMFTKEDAETLPSIKPIQISPPFSRSEIEKATKALRLNKSAGIDELKAEQLKYGPSVVYDEIAEIFNKMSRTGDYPGEIKEGILVPIPKPGKPKGPTSSLRPIILLSMLRKLLATCMMRRIGDRINQEIPPTQSAYRSGRGTTEQVAALKLMVEKAITSKDLEVQILMMDMSRAFDTVNRSILLKDLENILEPGELHIIKLMIEDVKLTVEVAGSRGEVFKTNVGTPQGDCLSPTLFTLYLAKGLGTMRQSDHTYYRAEDPITNPGLPVQLDDHRYARYFDSGALLNLQYADDITWIGGNCRHAVERLKNIIPNLLMERDLTINTSKTEEYTASREDSTWQNCRYLGSILQTEKDMKRREQLAHGAYSKLKPVFEDKNMKMNTKMRIFNALIGSIYLYNSELWTLTAANEKKIDICQRNFLRKIVGIKYPQTINNEELYRRTKQLQWTTTVRRRRLRWYGHLLRMPENTPARQAFNIHTLHATRRPRGGRKLTWLETVSRDLLRLDITREQSYKIAEDRVRWRQLVHSA